MTWISGLCIHRLDPVAAVVAQGELAVPHEAFVKRDPKQNRGASYLLAPAVGCTCLDRRLHSNHENAQCKPTLLAQCMGAILCFGGRDVCLGRETDGEEKGLNRFLPVDQSMVMEDQVSAAKFLSNMARYVPEDDSLFYRNAIPAMFVPTHKKDDWCVDCATHRPHAWLYWKAEGKRTESV